MSKDFELKIEQIEPAIRDLARSLGTSSSLFVGGYGSRLEKNLFIGDIGGMSFYVVAGDSRGVFSYHYHLSARKKDPFKPLVLTTVRGIAQEMRVNDLEDLLCKLTVHYKLREKRLKLYERFVTQEDKNADC